MNASRKNIDKLFAALSATLRRQRIVLACAGLALLISVAGANWLLLSAIAFAFILPPAVKITLLVLSLALGVYISIRFIIRPTLAGDLETLAATAERHFAGLRGRLVATVQFIHRPASVPSGSSAELIDLTARQTLDLPEIGSLAEVVDQRQLRQAARPFLFALISVTTLAVFWPGLFDRARQVYGSPLVEVAPQVGYDLTTYPTASQAVRFRDFEIGAALVGERIPSTGSLFYRFEGGDWREEKSTFERAPHHAIDRGDSLAFSVRLREVKRSFEFYAQAGRRVSVVRRVTVVDRPRIEQIAVTVTPPAYTKTPPFTQKENTGAFSAPVGSHATISVTSALPIVSGELVFTDGATAPISWRGGAGEAPLTVDSSRAYVIRLVDSLGEENPDPIQYDITAVPDEYPSIDITQPGRDADLDESLQLPLSIHIADDYGFSSLALKYRLSSQGREGEENVVLIDIQGRFGAEGDVTFPWNLDRLNLQPGDLLTYWAEIRDNDAITGPKASTSRVYHARLPSVEELIAEVDRENDTRIEDTHRALEEQKRFAERLKETERQMRAMERNQELDFKQKQNLQELADKSAEMSQELSKLAEEMKSALERQDGAQMTNQEISEKLREIQKLFEEVATPEMLAAREKLREAMEKMDKEEIEQALKEFELSQEELLNRLERTLELLKRMRAEQKMNALTRAAKEIYDRQVEVNEKTDKAESEKLESIAPNEERNTAALENLKKEAEELRKELAETDLKDSPEAQAFADAIEKTDADQDMKEMSRQLRQSNKSNSSKSGKSAEKKLKELLDTMREQQQAMNSDQQEEMKAQMRRLIDDANYLSREQETLLGITAAMDQRASALRPQAAPQKTLGEAVSGFGERLSSLARKNPFLSTKIRTLVTDALYNMDQAMNGLSEARGLQAAQTQRNAMAKINEVSLSLLEGMQKQSQCNKGGSCDKGGQKLESLTEKQNQLNRETESQCKNPGGSNPRPSEKLGSKERLGELAGQQAAIQKSLEELEREFGDRQEILGDLDAVAKEMDKVVEELSSGQPGSETLERQLRIYSRMLESTRALNRRDFTPERQARAGADVRRASPADLFGGDDAGAYEERLNKFLREGFPPEYEQQVRDYFRALTNPGASGPTPAGTIPSATPTTPAPQR